MMASPNWKPQSSSTLSRSVGMVALSALSSLVVVDGFHSPALGVPAMSRGFSTTSVSARRGALGVGMVATRRGSSDWWASSPLDLGHVAEKLKRKVKETVSGDSVERADPKIERTSQWKEEREASLLVAYKASLAARDEQSTPSVEETRQEITALAILASRRVKGEELCLACMAQAEKLHADLLRFSAEAQESEGLVKAAKKNRAEGTWKDIQRTRQLIEATVHSMAEAEESLRAFKRSGEMPGEVSGMSLQDDEGDVSLATRQARIMSRLQSKRDKIVQIGSAADVPPPEAIKALKRDRVRNKLRAAKNTILRNEQQEAAAPQPAAPTLSVHQMNKSIREFKDDYAKACDAAWTA